MVYRHASMKKSGNRLFRCLYFVVHYSFQGGEQSETGVTEISAVLKYTPISRESIKSSTPLKPLLILGISCFAGCVAHILTNVNYTDALFHSGNT